MIDQNKMKERLEAERALVESELATVAQKGTTPEDWVPSAGEIDTTATEPDERADAIEQFETNTEITKELEIRLKEINRALEKIEQGTYGICEVSGEPIEADRLEANPSARTCKEHMGDALEA
jgi:RNA polymerase-binding transcription factor DksA